MGRGAGAGYAKFVAVDHTLQQSSSTTTPAGSQSPLASPTPPRTSTPSRPSPNSLARNDARNTRSTQRTQLTVRAQLGLDHISTLNAHYNDEAYRQRYVHENFMPEQIARALRATKGGIAGRPACCAARARP